MSRWGIVDASLEGRQAVFFPWFTKNAVPLDPEANRLWRLKHFFTTDQAQRKLIRKMCAEDFLFFTAGFVTIFDAGDESDHPGPVPFIPYDYQIELFTLMWDCLHERRRPSRYPKPRKMGLTWSVLEGFFSPILIPVLEVVRVRL